MYLTVEIFLHSSMEHDSSSGCFYLMFWYCFLNDLSVSNAFFTFERRKWCDNLTSEITWHKIRRYASILIHPLCRFKKSRNPKPIWIKPWLKSNDKSAWVNIFSVLLLTDKFRHYFDCLFIDYWYTRTFITYALNNDTYNCTALHWLLHHILIPTIHYTFFILTNNFSIMQLKH